MSDTKKKIVYKRLSAHNTIWHPESTLIFKSQKEKLVIGRYVNEKIIALDDEALELCEEWKFKPDESLLAAEEEGEEEGTEEAEEPEAEEAEVEAAEEPEAVEEPEAEAVEEPEVEAVEEPEVEAADVEAVEEAEEPEVETVAETVETEVEEKPTGVDVAEHMKNLTESFSEKFCQAILLLQQEKLAHQKSFDMYKKKSQDAQLELKKQLDRKTSEHAELQAQYDSIKKKFDTMKSLFN